MPVHIVVKAKAVAGGYTIVIRLMRNNSAITIAMLIIVELVIQLALDVTIVTICRQATLPIDHCFIDDLRTIRSLYSNYSLIIIYWIFYGPFFLTF